MLKSSFKFTTTYPPTNMDWYHLTIDLRRQISKMRENIGEIDYIAISPEFSNHLANLPEFFDSANNTDDKKERIKNILTFAGVTVITREHVPPNVVIIGKNEIPAGILEIDF